MTVLERLTIISINLVDGNFLMLVTMERRTKSRVYVTCCADESCSGCSSLG